MLNRRCTSTTQVVNFETRTKSLLSVHVRESIPPEVCQEISGGCERGSEREQRKTLALPLWTSK